MREHDATYRDRGFEIIGVSCDGAQEAVEEFVARENIPCMARYRAMPRCGKCPASRRPRKNGLVVRCGFDAGEALSLSSHDASRVERVSENVTRTDIVFVVHPSSSNMR
jgi:hypothetical protein